MSNLVYKTTIEDQRKITRMTWTVPDFMTHLNDGNTKELRTEHIKDSTSEETNSRFQLKMQFKGRYNDIIEIYFLTPNPVFLEYKLILFGIDRYRDIVEKDPVKYKGYHIVHALKWQYALKLLKENRSNFLVEKSFMLKFEFIVTCKIKVDSHIPEVKMSNDFENLLKSGLFSDITMKSSDALEHKVHKVVLASRSPVLRAHFEHNTTECTTNVIESPLEDEVLQEVITFIYSDKAPKVDMIPEKLLAAADFYHLSRLKSLCEETLHKTLTLENALDILQLADLYSATALKQWTLEFIKDGRAKLITETEGWEKLSGKFIKMIYEFIMDNVDENGVYSLLNYKVKNLNIETD